MEISVSTNDGTSTIVLVGKLTVQTSPELSAAIEKIPQEVTSIDFDLTAIDYIASAGLRVFVAADKLTSARGGTMRLINPCDDVYEVLDMTGLAEVFTIER